MLTFDFSLNCCCWLVNKYYQVTKTSVGIELQVYCSIYTVTQISVKTVNSEQPVPCNSNPQTPDMGHPSSSHVPYPPLVISGGHQWRPVQTCSLQDTPLPVMTSGGWSTYGGQAGSTYPTGMLSCLYLKLPFNYQLNVEILTEIKVTVIWQW